MNGKALPRHKRAMPIDRHTGMARQFSWTGSGFHFRRDGYGAPVPVTEAERKHFLNVGRRSLLTHIAALGLVVWAALLLSERVWPDASSVRHSAFVALIAALVGLVLYRSHGWYVDAPGRALAGRPAVGPPGEIDVTRWPSYDTIAMGVVIVIVMVSLHWNTTLVAIAGVSVAATVVGLGVAVMKWWFERGFTPKQQLVAAERRATERRTLKRHAAERAAQGPAMSGWQILLLFVFLIVEGLVILFALMGTMAFFIGASGSSYDDPAMLPFVAGMILGFALGMLLVWPLEKLCKRWTTTTVSDAFNGF